MNYGNVIKDSSMEVKKEVKELRKSKVEHQDTLLISPPGASRNDLPPRIDTHSAELDEDGPNSGKKDSKDSNNKMNLKGVTGNTTLTISNQNIQNSPGRPSIQVIHKAKKSNA